MTYDSRADTLIHSQRVGELMIQVVHEVLVRSTCHDRSKTLPPEVEVFDKVTPRLRTLTYGSDEYKASLAEMGDGLAHHYAENRHHPEHFEHGVNDMTLADLIEMLTDWKAATESHADGDLARSLEIQRDRFGLSDQLVAILRNTAEHFGWLPTGTWLSPFDPEQVPADLQDVQSRLEAVQQADVERWGQEPFMEVLDASQRDVPRLLAEVMRLRKQIGES